jgi:hypothetical protein
MSWQCSQVYSFKAFTNLVLFAPAEFLEFLEPLFFIPAIAAPELGLDLV